MCQALYEALGIHWPARQMQSLLFTMYQRIVIKLKGLPFSLQAKGSNPLDL